MADADRSTDADPSTDFSGGVCRQRGPPVGGRHRVGRERRGSACATRWPQDHVVDRRGLLTVHADPNGEAIHGLLADTAAGAHDSDLLAGIE